VFNEDEKKKLMEKVIINKPKEKELQNTMSWSTNILIRMFYILQELTKDKSKTIKSFIELIKSNTNISLNKESSAIKLEESGYLTFIDMNKDESAPVKTK
jgi:hypothetical protein